MPPPHPGASPMAPSSQVAQEAQPCPSRDRLGRSCGSLRDLVSRRTWWPPRNPGTALGWGMWAESKEPPTPCPQGPLEGLRAVPGEQGIQATRVRAHRTTVLPSTSWPLCQGALPDHTATAAQGLSSGEWTSTPEGRRREQALGPRPTHSQLPGPVCAPQGTLSSPQHLPSAALINK